MSGMDILKNHKEQINLIAEENGIANIRVFGSVVRNEDGPDSDIDLLVNIQEDRTLFDVIRFKYKVEELVGREVDVISERAVHKSLVHEIIDKAVQL